MGLPLFQVDVFTDTPFSGNPAAVCLLTEPRSDEWMQQVAREMNLSETAFLSQVDSTFHLRWFTPRIEVDLCGHATLASAHVLWEREYLKQKQMVQFHTRSGILSVQRTDPDGKLLELDFRSEPLEATEASPDLVKALNVPILSVWRTIGMIYLIETDTEQTVRSMHPDISLLAQLPARSVILTSRSTTNAYDFVSRYFAPRLGIDEDPVTGLAHRYLGPFWSQRLAKKHLLAYQASPRGGVVHIRIQEDRVYLGGQTITVFQGELLT